MLLGSIFDGLAWERLVLLALGFVLELLERLSDVAGPRKVDLSPVVVPVEGDPDVSLAVPLGFDLVVVLEGAL